MTKQGEKKKQEIEKIRKRRIENGHCACPKCVLAEYGADKIIDFLNKKK